MPYTSRYPSSRSFYYNPLPTGVKWLLIVNTALFVLYFFAVRVGAGAIFGSLSLWPRAVLTFPAIWQLFTYMFLHDPYGFGHILFNMFALWMFGTDLERDWGTKRFLQFYFLCGIGAGVSVVLANAFTGSLDTRTIGASGAIYGLLLAFGLLYPDRIILFSFLFPIKAKYFVMIIGVIAFMSSLGASGGGISHFAHLGGMIFGYIYLRKRLFRFDLLGPISRQYQNYKVQRAKRRFETYMRKQNSDRDRWIN